MITSKSEKHLISLRRPDNKTFKTSYLLRITDLDQSNVKSKGYRHDKRIYFLTHLKDIPKFTASKITGLKKITRITLDFRQRKFFQNEQRIKELLLGIKGHSYLINLSLSFQGFSQLIDDKKLQELYAAFRRNLKLNSISLNFTSCVKITDKGFNLFVKLLPKLKELRDISINLTLCAGLSEKGIQNFINSLSYCTSLRTLSLNFSSLETLADQCFNDLGDCFENLHSLESLQINFSLCTRFTHQGVVYFSNKISQLKSIQKLTIIFDRCDPNLKSCFGYLFKEIGFLNKLTFLSLNLTGSYEITTPEFTKLEIAFSKLKLLQSLELSFFGCKLSDQSLQILGSGLGRLSSLEKLDLELGLESVSDLGVQKLAVGFPKLKLLKELKILCDLSKNINGQGFGWITGSLEHLGNLTRFDLSLGRIHSLGDNLFRDIGRSLWRNKSIKSLALSFTECRNVTDNGLIEIGEYLAKMENLEELKIECNDKITMKGLYEVHKKVYENHTLDQRKLILKCVNLS